MEANFRNQQVIPVADSSGVDGRDDAVNEKLKDPGTVSNNPEKDSFKLIMEYKRSVVRICLFLGMPLVCAMAINNFVKGAHLIALLNCAMLLILGLLGFGLTKRIEEKFSYSILIRLFIAAAGMTLLYEIGFQSKFSRTEWCYIYPILVFFAVGAKEGAIWVSIFYAVVAFLMLNFDPQRITLFEIHGLRTRFLISFFAVCILSFLLEHGYRRVQQRLLHHHGILKESEDRYRQAYEKLNMETEERRRVEEALLHAAEEWRATFDSINDFVCILDLEGRILRCNKALKNFLGKPFNEIINHSCWELVLGTKDPIENCPFSRMKETRHRETTTVSIKDRWYRITIDPILDETHLLIGAVNIISDITERKQAEEDLGRLSQENAVMAEISRIISSTLNIEEVYDRFAEEVRKVLSFDRVSVSIINPDLTSVTITYASGIKVGDIEKGVVLPLDDPYQENAVRRRQGVLIQLEDENQLAKDYPHLVPHFRTGIRSVMTVPLISKDQVIGLLHFQSLKPNSYTAFHLKLAEKVGNQIAGAIASAQLFAEHKRAEEALKESEDRYRDLVECSQYLISTHDLQGRLLSVNQEGARLLGYEPRDLLGKNIRDFLAPEVRNEFDTYLQTFQKEGAAKGLMLLQTATGEKRIWEYNATLRTEGVASPIVRSIAHDVTERIRAEKAVTKLSQENAIMARIGRIISSTLNIKEVYEQFGEEVRKVIPFDWIGITMLDPEKGRLHNEYVLGNDVPGRELQMDIPVTGTFTEEVMRTRSVHLLHIEDRAELAARFPGLLPHFDSGFRSFLSVPLISKDKAIGVLHIFSLKSRTYTEADKNLAQSIGNQIAGAIANAQLFNERKRAEEARRQSEERFRDLYDHAPIGYHEYDSEGRITTVNQTDLEMLGYTREEMIGLPIWKLNVNEELVREQVLEKLAGKRPPGKQLERIYRRKDGTTFPVLIEDRLILDEKGRIKGIRSTIQDITERKRAEEALQRSEEEAKNLAHENAIMAEIGRIISSSLDVEEVYEQFAEEVRKLIPFDRIVINTIDAQKNTVVNLYMAGKGLSDRKVGKVYPLEGSGNAEMVRTRSTLLIQTEDFSEYKDRFPMLLSTFEAGFRSIMNVPLFSKGKVIGGLLLRSMKPHAYTDKDVRLAERVADQIAGAIANARLYDERKQAEEAARRLAHQNATVARIGRIISSTLNIEEVYDQFGEEIRKIIPSDWIGISIIDYDKYTFQNAYVVGKDIPGREGGSVVPLTGSFTEEGMRRESIQLVHIDDIEDLASRFPALLPFFHAGFRSFLSTPLIYKDRVIGVLHIYSLKSRAYTESDKNLVEAIGNQIAGAIANAQLLVEREQAQKDKQALEEQLRQSQKMEAIGRLAGGVAHDFNNLLTVIHGYCDLMLRGMDENNRFFQDLTEIRKASEQAASLTRQLLAFSRKQVLQPKILDINFLVLNMEKMLRRLIGEDIQLIARLSEDLGRVRVDPGQIEQVIFNLAVNARDAMPNGGKLTIETGNVVLGEEYARLHVGVTPGHYVMLSVSDTGIGMTPEIKERIFDPFFTTKEKGKGTGLGLSTVYGIVQQSGGTIWVYSEPGRGATFKIYLPRVDEVPDALEPKLASIKSLQGSETILLVEDDEAVKKFASTTLQSYGYKVLEAGSGEEALQQIMHEQPPGPVHLMVTDVVMPGMSGRELADSLRPLQPEMKVLFMSGYTDNAIVHHGVLDPGVAYIQKPFTPDALVTKVREVLDSPQPKKRGVPGELAMSP